jgi:hypothetical protein
MTASAGVSKTGEAMAVADATIVASLFILLLPPVTSFVHANIRQMGPLVPFDYPPNQKRSVHRRRPIRTMPRRNAHRSKFTAAGRVQPCRSDTQRTGWFPTQ